MLLVALLMIVGAGDCFAVKITGVTIEDVSSEYSNATEGAYHAEKLIGIEYIAEPGGSRDATNPTIVEINTGLNITLKDTHSTLSDNFFNAGQHGTMWMSNSTDVLPNYVVFDLGVIRDDVKYVKIWNYNSGVDLGRCVKDLVIYVSDVALPYGDPGWVEDCNVVLPQGPADAITPFGETVVLHSTNVRYVLFDIQSIYHATLLKYSGLSEVQFHRAPVNCAEAIADGLGLDMDFNTDCYVDLSDFAVLAEDWLKCNNPEDSNCL